MGPVVFVVFPLWEKKTCTFPPRLREKREIEKVLVRVNMYANQFHRKKH